MGEKMIVKFADPYDWLPRSLNPADAECICRLIASGALKVAVKVFAGSMRCTIQDAQVYFSRHIIVCEEEPTEAGSTLLPNGKPAAFTTRLNDGASNGEAAGPAAAYAGDGRADGAPEAPVKHGEHSLAAGPEE